MDTSSVDIEVVPLCVSPVAHVPMDATYPVEGSVEDFRPVERAENEDKPPSNQPTANFRLKHATDPTKFKPVAVPGQTVNTPSKQSPKNAFQTFKKAYFDPLSKRMNTKKSNSTGASATGFQSSRSLDNEKVYDSEEGTPATVPSKSQSHLQLHKKLSKGLSAQLSSIFRGVATKRSKPVPKIEHSIDAEPISRMAGDEKTPSITFVEPNKYFIEWYKDLKEPLVFGDEQNAGMRHGLLVHKCENIVIHITKKLSKIEIDHCKKITVVLPSVISACDIQHSDSVTVKFEQRCPGLSIANCQSLSVYIPRDSMNDLEVASCGDGSANIMVPSLEDPTEYIEHPVPFQFVHHFKDDKLISRVSPLYTH
eukprot:Gregarina_sp_Poly_1__7013@NODE_381_length_9070_cov_57_218594_g309_i1_p3_GENE_NODE_381_length_9070_cov_57_218594_g309_i1NODE_381_length_9070_cov_57_218594_g309_i1_p3_ORF_typecomplete_len366_score45_36CAP_C/PF08603_11/3_2e32TBCC/PF07986_12/7_3e05_NODE_381_length_9070_cov_57_218594_g309_i142545351